MTMLKSVITAWAGLLGSAHAFWRMECPGRVGLGRMDPLVDPGEVSSHVHAIHGSGAFGLTADTASLLDSDCTSCRVTQDKSAYWTPALYFKHQNGDFEMVEQVGGMLAYYLLNLEDIKAFPSDFQMIAGDNFRRNFTAGDPHMSDPAKSNWAALGQTTQDDLEQRAIGFNCLNYEKDPEGTLYRHFMPDKDFLDANCKDGLRLELMFPSCWDGKNVKSEDHKSHVAYPDLVMNGNCPDSHPVSLPGLLFETIWATDAFAGKPGMFVLANGDTTGFGYHGDFIMGWEEDLLKSAVKQCTNPSGKIEDCPVFDVVDEAKATACEMTMPLVLAAEKVLNTLTNLPGDCPLTYEGDDAKPASGSKPSSGTNPSPKPSPSETYKPGDKPTNSAKPLPGNVFKESAGKSSTSPESADLGVAAAPATTETPTTTAAPTPTHTYDSTQFITNGNMVTEILWDEEVVMVTEMVDATTTVTMTGAPIPASNVPVPDAAKPSLPEAAPAAPTVAAPAKRLRRSSHLHGHKHHL